MHHRQYCTKWLCEHRCSEYEYQQCYNDFRYYNRPNINTAESPYELSIDIKTNDDAQEELTVDESGYSAAIENDAMIGANFDVEITDICNPEEIVLKYDIREGVMLI